MYIYRADTSAHKYLKLKIYHTIVCMIPCMLDRVELELDFLNAIGVHKDASITPGTVLKEDPAQV